MIFGGNFYLLLAVVVVTTTGQDCPGCPNDYTCCDGYFCDKNSDCQGDRWCGEDWEFPCIIPMSDLPACDTSSWSHISNDPYGSDTPMDCGDCVVYVNAGDDFGSCDNYCAAQEDGLTCLNAWVSNDGTCARKFEVGCNFRFDYFDDNEALCQCGSSGANPFTSKTEVSGIQMTVYTSPNKYDQGNAQSVGQILGEEGVCTDNQIWTCFSPGEVEVVAYDDENCTTSTGNMTFLYNQAVYWQNGDSYLYKWALWIGACEPASLTWQDKLCRHNDDYSVRGISEHDCNQNGCCTWDNVAHECHPDTSVANTSTCTPELYINRHIYSDENCDEHTHSEGITVQINTCRTYQDVSVLATYDEVWGLTTMDWYDDSQCSSLNSTEIVRHGICSDGESWTYDPSKAPEATQIHVTISKFASGDCSGTPDEVMTSVMALSHSNSDCINDADGGSFYLQCQEMHGDDILGWLQPNYHSEPNCGGNHMWSETVIMYDTCVNGEKWVWSGACAPYTAEERAAVPQIVVNYDTAAAASNCDAPGEHEYINADLDSCVTSDAGNFTFRCIVPGTLEVTEFSDDSCSTVTETYYTDGSSSVYLDNTCRQLSWHGLCKKSSDVEEYYLTNECLTADSWEDKSYNSYMNECSGGVFQRSFYLSADCSGDVFSYEETVADGTCFYHNSDSSASGIYSCENPDFVVKMSNDDCGQFKVTTTTYQDSDCSGESVVSHVGLEKHMCAQMVGETSTYYNARCESSWQDDSQTYNVFMDHYNSWCEGEPDSMSTLTYGECVPENGEYVIYTWNGDCNYPGKVHIDTSVLTLIPGCNKRDEWSSEYYRLEVTETPYGYYGAYYENYQTSDCSDEPSDTKSLVVDGSFCNEEIDGGKVGFYDPVTSEFKFRKPLASETCDETSLVCPLDWVEDLGWDWEKRQTCENLNADRDSICDCYHLLSDIPECYPYGFDSTFPELFEYYHCTGYDCENPDQDEAAVEFLFNEFDTNALNCTDIYVQGYCFLDQNITNLCPTACQQCIRYPTSAPNIPPSRAPTPLPPCHEKDYFCGYDGCDVEDDGEFCCGTPFIPESQACCTQDYCTCNEDRSVCECDHPDRDQATCSGQIQNTGFETCDFDATECPDIAGTYEVAGLTGAKLGEDQFFYQQGCCVNFVHFRGMEVLSYTGPSTFETDNGEYTLTVMDDGILQWSHGYYEYPQGMPEQVFEIDCMSKSARDCSSDCLDCKMCATGEAPDDFDCGEECGHCQSCLGYLPCFEALELHGDTGTACTNEEPFQCVDDCLDCAPCADYLHCFDAIGDETCYSVEAAECLDCVECRHCLDTPWDPACAECEDRCRPCEPYDYCWDIIEDLGDVVGTNCVSDAATTCLTTCLECEPCADWMYCIDIIDGTLTGCEGMLEQPACEAYDVGYSICQWENDECHSVCSSIAAEDLCELASVCTWSGISCNTKDVETDVACNTADWTHVKEQCDHCTVLAEDMESGMEFRTCDNYCQYQGRECVEAWEEMDDDCTKMARQGCDFDFGDDTSDALCQCGELLPVHGTDEVHFGETSSVTLEFTNETSFTLSWDNSLDSAWSLSIRDGSSCVSTALMGGPLYDVTNPWPVSLASGSATLDINATFADLEGKTVTLEDSSGVVACALISKQEIIRVVEFDSGSVVTLGFVDSVMAVAYDLVGFEASCATPVASCVLGVSASGTSSCAAYLAPDLELAYTSATGSTGVVETNSNAWDLSTRVLAIHDYSGTISECTVISVIPTSAPTSTPTFSPTAATEEPTPSPTAETMEPTSAETEEPTPAETMEPTSAKTEEPTPATVEPTTAAPSAAPTVRATHEVSFTQSYTGIGDCDAAIPELTAVTARALGIAAQRVTMTKHSGCDGSRRALAGNVVKVFMTVVEATSVDEASSVETLVADNTAFLEAVETELSVQTASGESVLAAVEPQSASSPTTTQLFSLDDTDSSAASLGFPMWVGAISLFVATVLLMAYCRWCTTVDKEKIASVAQSVELPRRRPESSSQLDTDEEGAEGEGETTIIKRVTRLSTEQLIAVGVRE